MVERRKRRSRKQRGRRDAKLSDICTCAVYGGIERIK